MSGRRTAGGPIIGKVLQRSSETAKTMLRATLPFRKALSDQTAGQKKIHRRDYLPEGLLPVIDQGVAPVAGYTNDQLTAYRGPLPVLLFGDHTRLFKYVDFPFALGADGVKVLQPAPWYEPKFLYYYLQTQDIPSRGYSRHFKFVRQLQFPLIPLSEQRRIVEILDQADRLRRLRAEADAKADRILPALFIKMFGDPATNPMGWPEETLGSLARIVTGNTPSTKKPEYYGSFLPWARPADLDTEPVLTTTETMLSEKGCQVARVIPAGSTLVVCIGATLGKVGLAGKEMAVNQQINAVLPSKSLANEFLFTHCRLIAEHFRGAATKSTLPILNKSKFAAQRIMVPPLERQELFASYARQYLATHKLRKMSAETLMALFFGLLHRAFSGSLTASWREAHMKELLQEMEQQAKALENASG